MFNLLRCGVLERNVLARFHLLGLNAIQPCGACGSAISGAIVHRERVGSLKPLRNLQAMARQWLADMANP